MEQRGEIDAGRRVQDYYDREGWTEPVPGQTADLIRFGARDAGRIRGRSHELRNERVREAILLAGPGPRLIECGCGGNPALFLTDLIGRYTGIDFSSTGVRLAKQRLDEAGVEGDVSVCRMDRLPFSDGSFDVAYSAHALYHIASEADQAAAFDEIMRVVRGGGVAVFLLANPRPLFSPIRLLRRVIADAPGLSTVANRLRPTPVLPYKPMTLSWMRRKLGAHGEVRIVGHSVASTWAHQHITERGPGGRLFWRAAGWLERRHPGPAASLGNYVLITVIKAPDPGPGAPPTVSSAT